MSGRSPAVVVIGGTYIDMDIRCGQIPSPGQSVIGSALSYTLTGPGPTQAIEAALCGCNVHLISKVGGDSFAQTVKTILIDSDVDTEFIYTAKAKNTGVVVTLVNSEGENAVCYCSGANSALTAEDIEASEQIISEADVCLIHGKMQQEAIVTAVRCAMVHGTKVILNPAAPLEQEGQESGDLPADYFTVDILLSNLYEAAEIVDLSAANVRTAKLIGSDLVARGVGTAVITMGRRGCMVVDRSGADQIAGYDVELVDQAGSGDAFAGALAAYYAVEDDVRGAVKFASAAGALACTKFGSIEALPTKADIIELLQQEDTE
ncbi:MAG: ribokinase [Sedimentisphaerales bacterium]|nr:ribokinase [Sedimentisphaerales bacterium]